ncbi:MAG: hypothetical protein IPJ39_20685 [Saprospiraceae bacterium]|nr:hypothetical protein [Saprospiraceae bacterium]
MSSCGNVGANGAHNNNSTYNDNNGYPSEVPRQYGSTHKIMHKIQMVELLLNSVVMIFHQEQTMAYMM